VFPAHGPRHFALLEGAHRGRNRPEAAVRRIDVCGALPAPRAARVMGPSTRLRRHRKPLSGQARTRWTRRHCWL